jgi:hypothetical protein
MPEWWGPPDNWVGVTLPLDAILGRSERAAVWVGALTVYPAGFAFDVLATSPEDIPMEELGFPHLGRQRPEDWAAMLRIGMRFADWTTVEDDHPGPHSPDQRPATPVLRRSGGGGGGRYLLHLWAWPLPPPGPMSLVCQWPGQGIELTEHTLNGAAIRDAATRCIQLWPPGDPLPRPEPSGQ